MLGGCCKSGAEMEKSPGGREREKEMVGYIVAHVLSTSGWRRINLNRLFGSTLPV